MDGALLETTKSSSLDGQVEERGGHKASSDSRFDEDHFEFQVKEEELESSSYQASREDESVDSDESEERVPTKKDETRQKFRRFRHKEYQCDECNRMFTLKHNLQNHYVQYHMGFRTLHKACPASKCTICGKIYSAASVLAEHMLQEHEKLMEHEECFKCHAKFRTTAALHKHLREHNRVMKTCPYAGCEQLEFKYCKELNEHVRLKHKLEELSCSVCNMVFRQLSAKLRHEETQHEKALNVPELQIKEENEVDRRRGRKAKCDEDLVKREVKEEIESPPRAKKRCTFRPDVEAMPIKKKAAKRLTKAEILAKIK